MADRPERREGESLAEYKERVAYGRALAQLKAASTVEDLRCLLIGWVQDDVIRFTGGRAGPKPDWKR